MHIHDGNLSTQILGGSRNAPPHDPLRLPGTPILTLNPESHTPTIMAWRLLSKKSRGSDRGTAAQVQEESATSYPEGKTLGSGFPLAGSSTNPAKGQRGLKIFNESAKNTADAIVE